MSSEKKEKKKNGDKYDVSQVCARGGLYVHVANDVDTRASNANPTILDAEQ